MCCEVYPLSFTVSRPQATMNVSCVDTLQVAASPGCSRSRFTSCHSQTADFSLLIRHVLAKNSECQAERPKGRKAPLLSMKCFISFPSGSNLSNLPGSEPSLSTFWSLVLPQDMIFAIHRAIGHCALTSSTWSKTSQSELQCIVNIPQLTFLFVIIHSADYGIRSLNKAKSYRIGKGSVLWVRLR